MLSSKIFCKVLIRNNSLGNRQLIKKVSEIQFERFF